MGKALVIGFGISGRSATKFLLAKGWQISAFDRNATGLMENEEVRTLVGQGVELFPEDAAFDLKSFSLAILSPGVSPAHHLVQKVKAHPIEIIGEVELAFRFVQQPVIAITGTNGKTTVTLLVEHILNHAGKRARALGNVGIPLAAEMVHIDQNEILVVELSSFQLETMSAKKIDAGAILNITPDHLDRYASMLEYAKAKIRMQDLLKESGRLFVEEKTFSEFSKLFQGRNCLRYGYDRSLPYSTDLSYLYNHGKKTVQLPDSLQGSKSHDLENALAAYALCAQFGVEDRHFSEALETFQKPHHRIEFVRQVKGVSFYDDSKGTNIDAVQRAVEKMKGPVILIAGGVDKGAPYAPWASFFKGKVKKVLAMGQAAHKIKSDLHPAICVEVSSNLSSAVNQAYADAMPGDVILLSPGCSSYDMFRDYAHRGEEFQRLVNQLKE